MDSPDSPFLMPAHQKPHWPLYVLAAVLVVVTAIAVYAYLPSLRVQWSRPGALQSGTLPTPLPSHSLIYVSGIKEGETRSSAYTIDPADASATPKLYLAADARTGRSSPVISPDGKSVAYLAESATSSLLVVADADGSNPRQPAAPADVHILAYPAWSPDGTRIAYAGFASSTAAASSRSDLPSWNVYETDLQTGFPHLDYASAINPQFAPNGYPLILQLDGLSLTGGTGGGIQTTTLVWGMQEGEVAAANARIVLSADKTHIAWINPNAAEVLFGTTLLDRPAITLNETVSDMAATSGAFSPDGSKLAVMQFDPQTGKGYRLTVINVTTGAVLWSSPLPFLSEAVVSDWR